MSVSVCLLRDESDDEEDDVRIGPMEDVGDWVSIFPLHKPMAVVAGVKNSVPEAWAAAIRVSRLLHRVCVASRTKSTDILSTFKAPTTGARPVGMSPGLAMEWNVESGVNTRSVMGNEWQNDDFMAAVSGAVSSSTETTGVVLSPTTTQTILDAILRAEHRSVHGTPEGETDTAEFYVERVKRLIGKLVFGGKSRAECDAPTSVSALLNVPYGDGVNAIPAAGSIRMSTMVELPPPTNVVDLASSDTDSDGAGAGAGAGADPTKKRRRWQARAAAPPGPEKVLRTSRSHGVKTLRLDDPYGLTPDLGVGPAFVNNHWGVLSVINSVYAGARGQLVSRLDVPTDEKASSWTSPWVYYDSSPHESGKAAMWRNPTIVGASRVLVAVTAFATRGYEMTHDGAWLRGGYYDTGPSMIPYRLQRGGVQVVPDRLSLRRFIARPPLQHGNTTVCGLAAAMTAVDVAIAADAGHVLYAETLPFVSLGEGARVAAATGRAWTRPRVLLGRPPNILSDEDMTPVRQSLAFVMAYGVLPSRATISRVPPEATKYMEEYATELKALLDRLRRAPTVTRASVFVTVD